MKSFSWKHYFFILALSLRIVSEANGNGRLMEPPSRASLWRFKNTDPALAPFRDRIQTNYEDMNLDCGGRDVRLSMIFGIDSLAAEFSLRILIENDGKCGICGDLYSAPVKYYQDGGKYDLGIVTRHYTAGQIISAEVDITMNQHGYLEFRLCPRDDATENVTQDCFEMYKLGFDGGSTKWYLPTDSPTTIVTYQLKLKLPDEVVCSHCILQWRYRTGNSWGSENGKQGLGYGQQDEFLGCADVSIKMKLTRTVIKSTINLKDQASVKVSASVNLKWLNNMQVDVPETITGSSTTRSSVTDTGSSLAQSTTDATLIDLTHVVPSKPNLSQNLTSISRFEITAETRRNKNKRKKTRSRKQNPLLLRDTEGQDSAISGATWLQSGLVHLLLGIFSFVFLVSYNTCV